MSTTTVRLLRAISYLGLLLTVLPAVLVFTATIELNDYKAIMLVGTILYLATAPFWINRGGGGDKGIELEEGAGSQVP